LTYTFFAPPKEAALNVIGTFTLAVVPTADTVAPTEFKVHNPFVRVFADPGVTPVGDTNAAPAASMRFNLLLPTKYTT
jgi:hypothetical protein